jgi:hypothetical protein
MSQKLYLVSRLRWASIQLEDVEAEIRGIESLWGGPPNRVNIIQYEHDPVAWGDLVRARSRYAHLLEERERLKGLVAALQRKLEEVAG